MAESHQDLSPVEIPKAPEDIGKALDGLSESAGTAAQAGREIADWVEEEAPQIVLTLDQIEQLITRGEREKARTGVLSWLERGGVDKRSRERYADNIITSFDVPIDEAEPADLLPAALAIEKSSPKAEPTPPVKIEESLSMGGATFGEQAPKGIHLPEKAEVNEKFKKTGRSLLGCGRLALLVGILGLGGYVAIRNYGSVWDLTVNTWRGIVSFGDKASYGLLPGSEARKTEKEAKELDWPEGAYISRLLDYQAVFNGGRKPDFPIRYLLETENDRRVIENPQTWTEKTNKEMQVLMKVLKEKKVPEEEVAEKLIAVGQSDIVGSYLLEILARMYKEQKPLAEYNSVIEEARNKYPKEFEKYQTDRNEDGQVGVFDVLVNYYEDVAVLEWARIPNLSEGILTVEQIVKEIPPERLVEMDQPDLVVYAGYLLNGDFNDKSFYTSARELGGQMWRASRQEAKSKETEIASRFSQRKGHRFG